MPRRLKTDSDQPPPDRSGALRVLRLLAVCAILVPLAIVISGGVAAWNDKDDEAWESNDHVTELAQSNISRLIKTQMMVLEETAALTETVLAEPDAVWRALIIRRLANMQSHMPHVREIAVLGADGSSVASTHDTGDGPDLAMKQEFLRFFLGSSARYRVSRPMRMESHGTIVVVAMRRSSTGGAFAGVVLSIIDQAFLEATLHRTATASPDHLDPLLELRRGDGALLAASPQRSRAEQDAVAAVAMLQGTEASGRLLRTAGPDGAEYLTSWRRLEELDLFVTASLPRSEVLSAWWARILPHSYFDIAISLALFLLALFAIRRERAVDAARRQWEKAEEAHRQNQKMEALGKLTGGLAHDFNNLLAVILGSTELARRRRGENLDHLLDAIGHAAERAARLTRQLLSFSRSRAVAPRVIDLHAELPRLRAVLQPALRDEIRLTITVPQDVWAVEIDPDEWESALLNVALNAGDAMPQGGQLSVTAANVRVAQGELTAAPDLVGEFVVVSLRDTGIGMTPEVARRAFEPFFTTKETGRGTGLGLSQVYGFARQSGGTATVDSDGRTGSRVSLYLPRSAKLVSAPEPPTSVEPAPDPGILGQRRVLLVEDNRAVADITRRILDSLGCEVHWTDRAQTALDMLSQAHPRYELLLSELRLPGGISGAELAETALQANPDLAVILTSGLADGVPAAAAGFTLLRKPYSLHDLAAAVRDEMVSRPTRAQVAAPQP